MRGIALQLAKPRLDDDAQESLRRRAYIGHRCIALAHDGPWTAQDGEDLHPEDRETYATDAISDILTAIVGRAGVCTPPENDGETWKLKYDAAAKDAAAELLLRALRSWEGDAEDYTVETPEADAEWLEPLREMGGYRHDG